MEELDVAVSIGYLRRAGACYRMRATGVENVLLSRALPVDKGCHPYMAFECLGEVALSGEAYL